ncbi:MAG: PhnD/SsuA/transferrin family substrate-binding protein [Smithellaceae bacterium]|nr:PhnD/SsuA/transferrin family substrate-binding protein [Smithellaceae bacterium]
MTGYRNKHKSVIVIVIMLTLFLVPSVTAARKIARIGVLANLGKETALKMWTPTADYLTASIPTHSFMLVPLGFDEISRAVERGEADFVLTNPGVYVELEHAHGVARIATVDTLWEEKEYNRYGGVIFTRVDRKDIEVLRDLKGKNFMAVHETSYGGWRAAWRELKAAGVEPARHFSRLLFSGESQEQVVFSVWNKEADAGTVRTGILERLAKEGRIGLGDFKILNPQNVMGFPLLLSTRLYPEWAFGRLRHTSDELAKKTAAALLNMPSSAPAAKAGEIAGFTVPCDYRPVHELMQELRIAPYMDYGKVTVRMFVSQYRYWIAAFLVLTAVAAVLTFIYNKKLRWARDKLEIRVSERTAELKRANINLKTGEEYNRTLFELSPTGLALCRMDGTHLDVNPAYAMIIGRTVEETLRLTCQDITPDKYAGQELAQPESLEKTGRYGPFEKEYIHKNGNPVPVRLQCRIIEQRGEKLIWSSLEDITERKQAEEALRNLTAELEGRVVERTAELKENQLALLNLVDDLNRKTEELAAANVKLQELDRLKSMFIASMSHELRTPLNSIIGFTGIIMMGMSGPLSAIQKKQLGMVKNSANHLLALINDVIDVSKVETGKVELAVEPFDLSALVSEVKDSFAIAAAEKGLNLELKAVDLIPVKSDRRRVRQILINLVGNAIKFTESGTVSIFIADEGEMVEIRVRDTGIGLTTKDMERLFDAFSRIHIQDRPVIQGTGLGLYLSRRIAALLGGKITADSEPGRGSVFTLSLPRTHREEKA